MKTRFFNRGLARSLIAAILLMLVNCGGSSTPEPPETDLTWNESNWDDRNWQ